MWPWSVNVSAHGTVKVLSRDTCRLCSDNLSRSARGPLTVPERSRTFSSPCCSSYFMTCESVIRFGVEGPGLVGPRLALLTQPLRRERMPTQAMDVQTRPVPMKDKQRPTRGAPIASKSEMP
jgi:hypothetical protein